MPKKPIENSARWCDCFNEYYKNEEDIRNYLDQKEQELGDDYDRIYDEDSFNELTIQKFPLVWKASKFHTEKYAESDRSWEIVQEVFDKHSRIGTKKLVLSEHMDRSDYKALNSLPASISQLKDLRELVLYRSHISYLPREIMHCKNLRIFDPYTSWRLHWLPYEITNCRLNDSTISTRALYGNYKLRPPFPNLTNMSWEWPDNKKYCSVCLKYCDQVDQYWISQKIGTDVVPLLASVCGTSCLSTLGEPHPNYVPYPHKGGLLIDQPEVNY